MARRLDTSEAPPDADYHLNFAAAGKVFVPWDSVELRFCFSLFGSGDRHGGRAIT
jgi:hypothetical protein